MQEYVQKSTKTTLPRNASGVRAGEFNQAVAPLNEGSSPSTGRDPEGSPLLIMALLRAMDPFMAIVAPPCCPAAPDWMVSISHCSHRLVPASDRRVSTVLSMPKATAATPIKTATPSVRRTHSPAPKDFFKKANTRPPARRAAAKEVAAPAA